MTLHRAHADEQLLAPWPITANRGTGSIDGGTPQANLHGGYRSWAETIAFLHRHLDR